MADLPDNPGAIERLGRLVLPLQVSGSGGAMPNLCPQTPQNRWPSATG